MADGSSGDSSRKMGTTSDLVDVPMNQRQNLRIKTEELDDAKEHGADTSYSCEDLHVGDDQSVTIETKVDKVRDEYCNQDSEYITNLDSKSTSKELNLIYKCEECVYICETKSKLEKHQLRHSEEKPFKCEKCSFRTTTALYLRRHYKRCPNIIKISYKCDKCDYLCYIKHYLVSHYQLKHTEEKPFKCDTCSFSTKYKNCLRNHQNIHGKMTSFTCEKCSFKTTTLDYLRRHLRQSHIEGKNPAFKCDECDKVLDTKTRLKEHQLTHTDVRPFQCTKCNFRAKTKCVLNRHQLVHKDASETQKFSCSQCDYVTKYGNAMKYHEMTHVRRHKEGFRLHKRFKCDICSFTTDYKHYLSIHQAKKHKDVRPFSCNKCSFKAETLNDLKEHRIEHKNLKLFPCNQCQYVATKPKFLRLHKKAHHTLEMVKCDKCDFQTRKISSLKKHYLKVHNETLPTSYNFTNEVDDAEEDDSDSCEKTDVCKVDIEFVNVGHQDIKNEDGDLIFPIKREPEDNLDIFETAANLVLKKEESVTLDNSSIDSNSTCRDNAVSDNYKVFIKTEKQDGMEMTNSKIC